MRLRLNRSRMLPGSGKVYAMLLDSSTSHFRAATQRLGGATVFLFWFWLSLLWVNALQAESSEAAPRREMAAEQFDVEGRRTTHWAWQPIQNPPYPTVAADGGPRSSIDSFIVARLEQAQLSPAPSAAKEIWLRRVTFDLIGLPPTPQNIRGFLDDASPSAFQRVVDRLLASPHFGERWGQHWLDLIRYAETFGHEGDRPIGLAYRYRDYIIRALNGDVPYDDLLVEHVAGDLVERARIDPVLRTNESIQATGFWFLGDATENPVDSRADECDRVANQIDVFSKTFLGLTLVCARCHDHKFDAISTRDYYGLFGYLQSSSCREADVADPAAQQQAFDTLTDLRQEYVPKILSEFAKAWNRPVGQLPLYLLAATELMTAGNYHPHFARPETFQIVAQRHGIDPGRLEHWTRHLATDAKNPRDPFHAFAAIVPGADRDGDVVTILSEDFNHVGTGTLTGNTANTGQTWGAGSFETGTQYGTGETVGAGANSSAGFVDHVLPIGSGFSRQDAIDAGGGTFTVMVDMFKSDVHEIGMELRRGNDHTNLGWGAAGLGLGGNSDFWNIGALGVPGGNRIRVTLTIYVVPSGDSTATLGYEGLNFTGISSAQGTYSGDFVFNELRLSMNGGKGIVVTGGHDNIQITFQPIPEPATPTVLAAGLPVAPELKQRIRTRLESEQRESSQRCSNRKVFRTIRDGQRNDRRTERTVQEQDFVVDYAQPGNEDWITNGYRFGLGPAKTGDAILGSDPDRPILRILEEDSACSDAVSNKFSGMLRTRTFEITSDTLWYRSPGKAKVYLVVDSYRMNARPLYAKTRYELNGKPQEKWQSHDVRDFIDHRVHLEITPAADDFSISAIRFASTAPADPFQPDSSLIRLLESERATSVASFAELYKEMFLDSLSRLASGDLAGQPQAQDVARHVNWLLDHADFFDVPQSKELATVVRAYLGRQQDVEKLIPQPILALAFLDGSSEDEPVHIGGDYRTVSDGPVPRGIPTAFKKPAHRPPVRGSGRLELARQLVDSDDLNPLVARVAVNRIWHHLFGRGIVPTVDNLGVLGEEPTDPELLDHLATEFVRSGWSTKRLIRRIVLSSTYRMSSGSSPQAEAADPDNRLLHHMPVRRLQAETIRDSVLAISGRLDRKFHGRSVPVHITPYMRGQRSPKEGGPVDGDGRRSIYIQVARNHPSHFLTAFDRPTPSTTFGRRQVSNVPTQALVLLNDPLVHEQATLWAEALMHIASDDVRALVGRAYLQAFGRPPEDWEEQAAVDFLMEPNPAGEMSQQDVAAFCHTLMNVKEFVYVR